MRRGEIYGLLGPNGAGKTTTVRMVCGLLPPTDGSVKVFGWDPTINPIEVKNSVGLVPEEKMLYESLTPREFFDFIASMRNLPSQVATKRIESLVKVFEMREYYDTVIAALSLGTKQKVAVINALFHERLDDDTKTKTIMIHPKGVIITLSRKCQYYMFFKKMVRPPKTVIMKIFSLKFMYQLNCMC